MSQRQIELLSHANQSMSIHTYNAMRLEGSRGCVLVASVLQKGLNIALVINFYSLLRRWSVVAGWGSLKN
jgi:hypothetical protein